MTNNYPEANVDESGYKIANNFEYSFAPGEGHHPANILQEKDWDIKSWPYLHPDGNFGLHHKRKVKITDQQYFSQRILNRDERALRRRNHQRQRRWRQQSSLQLARARNRQQALD